MPALPTGEHLRRLPLRAIVAYAARCALRVRSACHHDGLPDGARLEQILDDALALVAEFAVGGSFDLERGRELEEEVLQSVVDVVERQGRDRPAAFAANAAYAAINAANLAAGARQKGSPASEGGKAVMAAMAAADAAYAANTNLRNAIVLDYKRLQSRARGAFPELGTPVDVSSNGPLGALFAGDRSSAPATAHAPGDRVQEAGHRLERTRSKLDSQRQSWQSSPANLLRDRDRKREEAEVPPPRFGASAWNRPSGNEAVEDDHGAGRSPTHRSPEPTGLDEPRHDAAAERTEIDREWARLDAEARRLQELRESLQQTEADLESRRTRLEEEAARMGELQAELETLLRRYNVNDELAHT